MNGGQSRVIPGPTDPVTGNPVDRVVFVPPGWRVYQITAIAAAGGPAATIQLGNNLPINIPNAAQRTVYSLEGNAVPDLQGQSITFSVNGLGAWESWVVVMAPLPVEAAARDVIHMPHSEGC